MLGLGDFKLDIGNQSGYSGLFNTIDNSIGTQSSFMDNFNGLGNSISGLGTSIGSGLDSLGKYKDAIGLAGGLFGAYSDYNTANKMQDYYDSIMAEQARQVAKEQESTSNMQSGFASSGLFNPNKKTTTSNYYSV